jgi:hypothetical protein
MPSPVTRRSFIRLIGGLAGSSLLAACQSDARVAPTSAPAAGQPSAGPGGAPELRLVLANSELVVGQNRFAIAVLEGGRPVTDAAVKFEFFQLEGQTATKRSEADGTYRGLEGGGKGFYVARTVFDRAGQWGVQVGLSRPDRPFLGGRSNFEVLARGSAPMPGERAVPSRNPTAREVSSPSEICSAQPPCELHDLSIAEALARPEPLMLLFATPGYCTTQTCAPVLGEVQKVRARREGRANFVHVEIYKDPRSLVVADAVTEWNLQSEPWVFVIDRGGLISDRIESITNSEELEGSLAAVL